jgi:hypothetical protein
MDLVSLQVGVMAATRAPRDPRYSRTIGEPPLVGRRYVQNGRVRIEWKENGKWRRRTIGENTPANRRRADSELLNLLAALRGSEPSPETPVEGPVRTAVIASLDVADGLANWIRAAIGLPPDP